MTKYKKIQLKILSLVVLTAFLVSACSHTVQINTDPEGADISINGVFIGKSPVLYDERSGIPAKYYLKIEKKGYKVVDTTIKQSYKADETLLLLIPGILPYFFSADLEDSYKFPLRPKE